MYKNINAIVCTISIDYRRKCEYNEGTVKENTETADKAERKHTVTSATAGPGAT